jgi:hypothetical protein
VHRTLKLATYLLICAAAAAAAAAVASPWLLLARPRLFLFCTLGGEPVQVVAGGTHYPYGVVETGLRTAEIFDPAPLNRRPATATASGPRPTKPSSSKQKHIRGEAGTDSSGDSHALDEAARSARQDARAAARARGQLANSCWTSLPSMSDGHGYCAGCVTTDGCFMVSGGYDPAGTPLATAELYDPKSNTWSRVAPLPNAVRGACMVAWRA